MRVLLVEDDSATAASIEMMLRAEGFICDTTDLGEDGLEIGKLYDYDIIILDLMLPDIDGYEVLRRLRAARDRRLALFNDSLEEDGVLIDLVLTRSETRGRAPTHAPDSGFERLQAADSLVVVDTGRPPPPGFDEQAHAGALSFEMSHGRERIIVNCGAYRGAKPNWWRVARASAAHSVLVVADTNSAEIRDDGVLGRAPASVTCERAEHDGQQWISATHDGYRDRFGLIYTRELFLAADGDDLRGEDRLTGRPGAAFAVRFHLHPSVQASLVEDETAALLRLPSGPVWRLRAAGAEMTPRREHLSRIGRGAQNPATGARRNRRAGRHHRALGFAPRADGRRRLACRRSAASISAAGSPQSRSPPRRRCSPAWPPAR